MANLAIDDVVMKDRAGLHVARLLESPDRTKIILHRSGANRGKIQDLYGIVCPSEMRE